MAQLGLVLILAFCASAFAEDYYVKLRQNVQNGAIGDCLILDEETIERFKGYQDDLPDSIYVSTKAAVSLPGIDDVNHLPPSEQDRIIEIYARKQVNLQAHLDVLCKKTRRVEPIVRTQAMDEETQIAPEIRKIVDGGNQNNRIDVVFMGDGYIGTEREEFFEDMKRLTKDMFEGPTFHSYLPVFNIWAIYVESKYSGIGYNGPESTPFKLYREKGQLRAIYPGDANYARQICKLTGASGCDFPSIIGNDDFYGGLGGEFVISTKSHQTGTVVLRHEMGHNFVDVGEEYDNGYVYSGVNSARSVASLGWTHWLSGEKKEERAIYRLNEYPWLDLASGKELEYKFTSDGAYSRWYLVVSVSAAGEADSLEFKLDGKVLPWKSTGSDDRSFYDWYGNDAGFTAGEHRFSVRSKTKPTHPDVPRMISSINIHEFGNEDEFHADNSYVSAYPTWSAYGQKVFRPTNAGCLMRNMSSPHFCSVCKEGMWHQFFKRISLIDDVRVGAGEDETLASVTVETIKLGQLRQDLFVEGEKLEVRWFLDGVEIESLRNEFTISAVKGTGPWTVKVTFVTPEVRHDPTNLLTDSKDFKI